MTKEEALHILNALAEGCSPFTGEVIDHCNVLNEREVIRALQMGIDALKTEEAYSKKFALEAPEDLSLDEGLIMTVLNKFKSLQYAATPHKLTLFFRGSKALHNEHLKEDELFGCLKGKARYYSLKYFLEDYFDKHEKKLAEYCFDEKAWEKIDFFEKKYFCRLSEKATNQLRQKISQIELIKKEEDLSDALLNIRMHHPRSHEPWSETEKELLCKAMHYTNDLKLLSTCFQRGERSIEIAGKKLIFEGKVKVNN
jgi:hypothetical protein